MDTIFVNAIAHIQRNADVTSVTSGSQALENAKSRNARGYITDRIIGLGDTIAIPRMDGEDLERWIDAPAVRGGDDVFHCIAEVTTSNGARKALPIFIGNFVKEITDLEGKTFRNVVYDKAGNVIDLTSTAQSLFEQFSVLAGRKFKCEQVDVHKVTKRNRKTMVAYEGNSNSYVYREV